MGGSTSKSDSVVLSGGGAEARAALFTAPPAVTERIAGLDNVGNSCYCSAVLQSLYFVPPLRSRLAELGAVIRGDVTPADQRRVDRERFDLGDEDPLYVAEAPGSPTMASPKATLESMKASREDPMDTVLGRMCELFDALDAAAKSGGKIRHHNPKVTVNRIKKENFAFNNNQQQDAHEFASFLLNVLIDNERTLLGYKNNAAKSPLQALLCGRTVSKTYCGECDTETSFEQVLLDVNIDVAPNTSLRYCTELFSAFETLSGEDKFRCDACTSPVDARRRVLFKSVPDVLFIQLKRFSYSERMNGFTKRNDRVPFAPTMTIQTVDDTYKRYRLCGVVVHQGATPHMGHYVALCQSNLSRRWYKCDDETVTGFAERDLQRYFGVSDAIFDAGMPSTATAYMLFYSRIPES